MDTPDAGMLASELRAAVGRLTRRLRAEHVGFSLSRGAVLGRLDRRGGTSISELALAECVRPQSMAQTVGDLEADGLIARRGDPTDGRRSLLELTVRGRQALLEERRRREGWLARAIAEELSAEERRVLARSLAALAKLADA